MHSQLHCDVKRLVNMGSFYLSAIQPKEVDTTIKGTSTIVVMMYEIQKKLQTLLEK